MRPPRRALSLLAMLAALSLLAAACGDDATDEPAAEDEPAATEEEPTEEEPADEPTEVETEPEAEEEPTEDDAAADWPEQDITWIVAFSPGGAMDVEARRIQDALQEILGVNVNIEYREGGGGAIGWTEVAAAEPDGYTVTGLSLPHMVLGPLAIEDSGYETSDFVASAWQVGAGAAILVPQDSEFETLEDLVAAAEENPGGITFGGVDTYSASDALLAQFQQEAGVELAYVPVSGGGGPTMTALRGGHVQTGGLGSSHAAQQDDLRALAVAGDEPYAALPDVPLFSDLGYNIEVFYGWGVGMPAGVPDAINEKFGNAVIEAMEMSNAIEDAEELGYIPMAQGPGEAQEFLDRQVEVYTELVPLMQEMHGES